MTITLIEREAFPPGYRLDLKISTQDSGWDIWTCTNEKTGERALLRVIDNDHAADWPTQIEGITKTQGLVHECINLVFAHGEEKGLCYLLEPYLPECKSLGEETADPWPALLQLLDVLIYLQPLGICHGDLNPDRLLITPEGNLKITGLGITANPNQQSVFISPQIAAGSKPDPSDDTYAFGQMVHQFLNDSSSGSAVFKGTPLPEDIRVAIEQMTSGSVVDRGIDLTEVKALLTDFFEKANNSLSITNFSRAETYTERSETEAPVATRRTRVLNTRQVAYGVLTLVLTGLFLFTLLPTNHKVPITNKINPLMETSPDEANLKNYTESGLETQPPKRDGPTPLAAARLEYLVQEGQSIARDILKRQLNLEDHGIFLWANTRYSQLNAALDEAENLFREGQYENAVEEYTDIRDSLQELEESMSTRLQEYVTDGESALISGDFDTALTTLTIANAIAFDNPEIKEKLKRAENLEEVLNLARQAGLAEREFDYTAALKLFQAAAKLDPYWTPATEGLDRIKAAIKNRQFNDAMSAAFRAIALGRYDEARAGFNNALLILPDSPEPADGLAQVDQAETNDAINKKRQDAEAFVADENWQKAIESYEAALAISESLAFAREGLTYAIWRAEIDTKLVYYLTDPTLLQSNIELQSASGLLKEASQIQSKAVDFQRQIDSLAMLISTARIKIPVTIKSNGKTSVVIRKEADLGTPINETVYLIPGRYTITGQRPGYRDAREELVLIAGRPVPDIFIASTERIR